MKLNSAEESKLYTSAKELDLSFGALVQGYVIEATLAEISESAYGNVLWMADTGNLGKTAYETNRSGRLDFYYIESSKDLPEEKLVPGQMLSRKLAEEICKEVFLGKEKWHVTWQTDRIRCSREEAFIQLTGQEEGFQIPVEIHLRAIQEENIDPRTERIQLITDRKKKIEYLVYPSENKVSDLLIEVIMKLEFIGDMGVYLRLYDILTGQSVSGRRVINGFEEYAKKEPTFTKDTRLKQLRGYKNHPYMRKRWEKYRKYHGKRETEWSQVMECMLSFLEPVWKAFMEKEIFLEDWMPELGRFLS